MCIGTMIQYNDHIHSPANFIIIHNKQKNKHVVCLNSSMLCITILNDNWFDDKHTSLRWDTRVLHQYPSCCLMCVETQSCKQKPNI